MLTVDSVVKVSITRETVSKTVRDLQTVAILSRHKVFTDVYRVYTSSDSLLTDGFKSTDYAYISAKRIFDQNPQVSKVVVGRTEDSDSVDYVTELTNLLGATTSWFFLIADAKDDADKLKIAQFIEDKQNVYVYSDTNADTLDKTNTTDLASKLKALNLDKTYGIHFKDTTLVSPESAWVGRFASAVIGSNLWMYKTLKGLSAESYSSDEVETLKAKNIQCYTTIGADDVVAGNAVVASGERIFVILGVIWLEVRIGERYWNLLYSKERILYTNAGIELFRAELVSVLNEAVANNILTNDDSFEITVPDANKLTSQVRQSGILSAIKFRARLAGAIIYVDKVEGTVYP